MIKKVKNIVFVGLLSCFAAERALGTDGGTRGFSVDTSALASYKGKFKNMDFRSFASEEEDCAEPESLASFGGSPADVCPASDNDEEEYGEEVVQIVAAPQPKWLRGFFMPAEITLLKSMADYCATFKGSECNAKDIILFYTQEKQAISRSFASKVLRAVSRLKKEGLW